ncbi:polysaccharide deacetylase family protein [Paenibacillus sp. YYML68]|uniref:polysaccharide deacetylase family protein n=1 Tax=Paenibacillus sp. YYML68 TaxID=2909250 RepID=UPI002493CBD3|nr:polysaccharide deacetylase family protein [Paenibacillus sp. YYML68]
MTRTLLICMLTAIIAFSLLGLWSVNPDHTYRNQVAVLMYHHVHPTDRSSSTISPDLFREQLAFLKANGYQFITLDAFKRFYEGEPVPDKAVLVTFDDGYTSFHEHALPILKELDVPAVNFIVTEDLDAPGVKPIPTLTREEALDIVGYKPGMFDLQCHSHALHYKVGDEGALTGRLLIHGHPENEAEYKQRVERDSEACARSLAELYDGDVSRTNTFAYPFGIHSELAQSIIQQEGFDYAFTIVSGMATRNSLPLEIPRINAGHPDVLPEHLDKQIQLRVERAAWMR